MKSIPKMFFTFVLVSMLTLSAVLGRSAGPTSKQLTYTNETHAVMQSDDAVQVVDVDDRSTNLKYVMAIQSSSIWEEIKKRSLTINTPQGLDDTVAEQSPDNLTDQELVQLKQACHDGLKCVAVDQLLVLNQVREPLGDGKVSVRTVITKITQVLTQYTTEYHEGTYQYEAVNQSDDESKVYESVTTIVEDNKELCQIELAAEPVESSPKNSDATNTVPVAINHNNTVNYNTVENYNINNGTINNATINSKDPSGGVITIVESPDSGTHSNNDSDSNLRMVIIPETKIADGDGHTKKRSLDDHQPTERNTTTGTDTGGLSDDESVTKAPVNGARQKQAGQNHARGRGTSDQHYDSGSADDNREPTGANTHDSSPSNHMGNNSVSLKNVDENGGTGQTDCNCDIVSSGPSNHGTVQKGYVQDGTLNNGKMVQYNINNGTINKGEISNSSADNGIISVGTVNNGPVNYGTSNTYTNNGKQVQANNDDIQQYLSNIDKMYSTILERLG